MSEERGGRGLRKRREGERVSRAHLAKVGGRGRGRGGTHEEPGGRAAAAESAFECIGSILRRRERMSCEGGGEKDEGERRREEWKPTASRGPRRLCELLKVRTSRRGARARLGDRGRQVAMDCRGEKIGLSGARLQRRQVEARVRDDHVAHRVEGAPNE